MTKKLISHERTQTRGEEIANSVSHGVGFLAAVAASPVLIFSAVQHDSSAGIVGASVFAFTMALLYITSSLYHALAESKAKRVFQILDHGAIYLLISGTYTPFTLGVLRGVWGWVLFGIVWGIAVASYRGRKRLCSCGYSAPGRGGDFSFTRSPCTKCGTRQTEGAFLSMA